MAHSADVKMVTPLTSTPSNPSNTIEDWMELKTAKGRPYRYSRHWGVVIWLDDLGPPELQVCNDWLHLKSFAGGPDDYFSKSTGLISIEPPETREEYRLMRQVSEKIMALRKPVQWYETTNCWRWFCDCRMEEEQNATDMNMR